jgi:hypothetical protein
MNTLAKQYEQQSVQERFALATEKLKEVFIQIAEPVLAIVSPLMNLVGSVLPAINMLITTYSIYISNDFFCSFSNI